MDPTEYLYDFFLNVYQFIVYDLSKLLEDFSGLGEYEDDLVETK